MTWKTVLKVSETPKKTEDKKGAPIFWTAEHQKEYEKKNPPKPPNNPTDLPRGFRYTTTNDATTNLEDKDKGKTPTQIRMERIREMRNKG